MELFVIIFVILCVTVILAYIAAEWTELNDNTKEEDDDETQDQD